MSQAIVALKHHSINGAIYDKILECKKYVDDT
jgi:hypothetical protein